LLLGLWSSVAQKTAAAGRWSSRCRETPLEALRWSKEVDGTASVEAAHVTLLLHLLLFLLRGHDLIPSGVMIQRQG
jgi:hypothetical protein